MSGIISSYFIEPVIRQARRFSTAAQPANPQSDEPVLGAAFEEASVPDKHRRRSSKQPRSAKKQNTKKAGYCGHDACLNTTGNQRDFPHSEHAAQNSICACASQS